MMAGALAGAPAALLWVTEDWYERGLAILMGGGLLIGGIARALQQMRLTHAHLEVIGAWRVQQVPWERLHGARLDGTRLAIAWEPDMVAEVGPFQASGGRASQVERAEQLGSAMLRLRERALVAGAVGRPVRTRPGPAWGFLAAYSVLAGVAVLSALHR